MSQLVCVCVYVELCVCRGACIYMYLLEVRWYFFMLLCLHVYTSTVTKYTKEGREKSYQNTQVYMKALKNGY